MKADTFPCDELQRLRSMGCSAQAVFRPGRATKCISDTAVEREADLVVVESSGPAGASRYLPENVSPKAVKCAPCSVLIRRPSSWKHRAHDVRGPAPLRLLVAFDGSRAARQAVENVAGLSLPEDVELSMVTVLPLITFYRTDILQTESLAWQRKRRAAQDELDSAAAELRRTVPRVSTTLRASDNVSEEILKVAAEESSDIVVLGHRGKGAIGELFLGSVSESVARRASCSVWVVREPSYRQRRE
jgi:nucleotide-binding universal stress UspA family protein